MRMYGEVVFFMLFVVNFVLLLNGQQHKDLSKRINESLSIHCQCQNTSLCDWYHNDQPVPDQWVETNGDLLLPANDWCVYGEFTDQCGHPIRITNPGENCSSCLQLLIIPSLSNYPVGSVYNVSISTNISCAQLDNISLLVNDGVCNKHSDVVTCSESQDVNDTFVFTLTAVSSGSISIKAYTKYYDANWYSAVTEMIIADKKMSSALLVVSLICGVLILMLLLCCCCCYCILRVMRRRRNPMYGYSAPDSEDSPDILEPEPIPDIFIFIPPSPDIFIPDSSPISPMDVPSLSLEEELFIPPELEEFIPEELESSISSLEEEFIPEELESSISFMAIRRREYSYPVIAPRQRSDADNTDPISMLNKEQCPLKDCRIASEMFNHKGGWLLIEEYLVKLFVPSGAISVGYSVQIEAAASPFGPFIIPEDCSPISVYLWIGACYEFKKPLVVEMEHDTVVDEETNITELCVLTSCEGDMCNNEDNQKVYKMHEDTCDYQYEVNKSTCTFSAIKFCSKCLAAKGVAKKAKRVIMYHYLPEDYKYEHEFVAEVCFCYDLQFCRKRTEKRYAKRRMKKSFRSYIRIYNWKDDIILLSYANKFDGLDVYHLGDDKIFTETLDFRIWYDNEDLLLKDENADLFPPRFKLVLTKKDQSLSDLKFVFKICIESSMKRDTNLTLVISGIGGNKGCILSKNPNHPIGSSSSSYDFREFYPELLKILPMKDAYFFANLVKYDLLPGNCRDLVAAEKTTADMATVFLDHVIVPSLKINSTEMLNKLLCVMDESEYSYVKQYAEKIKIKCMKKLPVTD